MENEKIKQKEQKREKELRKPGDIIFDDNGDPLFFGDIEAELGKEHSLYAKKFDLPLNPAF